MTAARCLNCEGPLAGQAYCGTCGQKADARRLTLGDIGQAAVHVLTHADHSVLRLVRELALRPGRVAREYVAGKRRKYFNPFTFVLVIVGLAALVMGASHFVDFTRAAPSNPVSAFLQRNINLVILVQLPLLALFTRLLFRRERLHFAEHLVLASYTSGFRSIFFMLAVVPAWALLRLEYQPTVLAYLVLWHAYFGIACAQFFEGHRAWLWLKGVAASVGTQLATTAAIMGAVHLWFRFR
jgi:hypothetical protein